MPAIQIVAGRVTLSRPTTILVLVIASDNIEIYAEHEAVWRSYAKSHPRVTVYFLRQRDDVVSTYLQGDTVWSRGSEATERVFDKTIASFRIFPPSSYDYIVRTNLSSVWNFTRLSTFCGTLPTRGVFCGVLGNPGVSGAGMILSPDVVQLFGRHSGEIERSHWDDIDFGRLAIRCGISPRPATRYDPRSRSDVDACWDKGYHYYLKDMRTGIRNVANERDVMSYLVSKIYPGVQPRRLAHTPSFHILLATIGRSSLQRMVSSVLPQLTAHDHLTVVFDGVPPMTLNTDGALCTIHIYQEPTALGSWGHGIRTKYAPLLERTDFVLHADDDDIYLPDTIDQLRTRCTDQTTLYIARMTTGSEVYPKTETIEINNIGTPMGIIPYDANKNGTWGSRRGGDGEFYVQLAARVPAISFIPVLLYYIRPS